MEWAGTEMRERNERECGPDERPPLCCYSEVMTAKGCLICSGKAVGTPHAVHYVALQDHEKPN